MVGRMFPSATYLDNLTVSAEQELETGVGDDKSVDFHLNFLVYNISRITDY